MGLGEIRGPERKKKGNTILSFTIILSFVGIAVSGFFVILSAAVSGNEMAQWFSPVSWTTLNKLDVGKLTQYPTFTYVMVVYMTAIIILSVWIIKVIEKKDVGVLIREV